MTLSESFPVTWGHVTSFPVTWLPPPGATALYEVKRTVHASFRPSTATSRWLPVKWRHFRNTSCHLRSCDVISCHVTASSCELQPCRKSNTQYMLEFRSSTATSKWLPVKWHYFRVTSVTWGLVASFPVTWLPLPASYRPVGSQTHSIRQFSSFYCHFQVASGQMTSLPSHFRSPEVTWRHFLSRDCLFLRATAL